MENIDVLSGEIKITVKNQHRICTYKCSRAVAQTHQQTEKNRFHLNDEVCSFFLFLYEMMHLAMLGVMPLTLFVVMYFGFASM